MAETPKTLTEAVRHFADEDARHEYLVGAKWPDGRIVCPKCGADKIGRIRSRRLLQCKAKDCRKQFSAKVGTVFEDSPLPLSQWFVAVWCVANAKNGISSCELARALGVRQATAWFMLHRIRLAIQPLSGGGPFDDAMRKLAQVPKEEADRRAKQWKKRRDKREKKPKHPPCITPNGTRS